MEWMTILLEVPPLRLSETSMPKLEELGSRPSNISISNKGTKVNLSHCKYLGTSYRDECFEWA
jgi:hypothetical protein